MGTIGNLFEVLRDNSYREIEEEASREVVIALAGNTVEVRDKLQRALSTRLESLWTPSPFRLIEPNERPGLKDDDENSGLLLYSLYKGDRIPAEKRRWLGELAQAGVSGVTVIIAVLERKEEEDFNRQRRTTNRLQAINPLRLVGGRESGPAQPGNASADGAAFNNAEAEMRPAWETELEELTQAGGKLKVVELKGLELAQLQAELLPAMVKQLNGRELALARRAPIFRNTVATQLISDTARSNAQTVLFANAAAGIPLLGDFLDNGADFVLLTKNQFELSHRLAGVYGQKRDSRVEVYLELVPILGAAFVWKTLSSMAARRIPVIASMLPKALIAYSATMVVGRAAQLYYSSGRKAPAQVAAVVRRFFEQLPVRWGGSKPTGATDSPRRLRSS